MDIFTIFNLVDVEKAAYKSLKRKDSGKDLAKNLVVPGTIFCLTTAAGAIIEEIVDEELLLTMKNWFVRKIEKYTENKNGNS